MAAAFLWGSIGVLILFILIGFLAGLIRGLKRSALHIIFFVVSFVIAFFITKPITSAILGISITIDGTTTTLNNIVYSMLNKQFNLGDYQSVGDFAKTLPLSVASPIAFIIIMLVTYFLFDIIYLIVARLAFGKKKKDFATKKPLRWYGSAVGAVEGFLFMFLLFAPLTSLTQTYQSLTTYETEQAAATTLVLSQDETQGSSTLPLLPELVGENVPSTIDEIITQFNNSVIGKVSGAGGLNHALFDYLSSSKVNKETIHLRKDLLALADTYNEFAIAYNQFTANDFENIDLTALKTSLEKFLNEGIFKGVLAPTVQEFVVNFDVATAPDFVKNNELLSDLAEELKTAFTKENFVAKTYLKEDLLKLVDIADAVIDSGLVQEFKNLETSDITAILKTISENNEKLQTLLDEAADLHVLQDGFDAIGNFASKKMGEFFEDENIKLNFDSLDKVTLITDTFDALSHALEVSKQLDFAKLFDGDLMGGIEGVENIDQVLIEIGKSFDDIRKLEILTHPAEEPGGKPTYVLDEIMKKYKFSLITGYEENGEVKFDEVHAFVDKEDGSIDEKVVKIDSYENFCTAIARSVKVAQKLGLFHIGTEGSDFEAILESVLDELHLPKPTVNSQPAAQAAATATEENTELLSQILLPFFELEHVTFNNEGEEISVRDFIFKNIIESLDDGVEQIDLTFAVEAKDYDVWKGALDDLCKTLVLLDDRDHKIEVETSEEEKASYTYMMYLLSEKVQDSNKMKTILDHLVKDQTLKGILKQLLSTEAFDKLVDQILDQLDSAITDVTHEAPEKMTDRKTLIDGREDELATAIENLVTLANKEDPLGDLTGIGATIDSLKNAAKHDGEDDGVLKGVFENLIWYITGDDSINEDFYAGKESQFNQDTRKRVKEYLLSDGITDYYEINYTEKFEKFNDAVKLLDKLKEEGLKDFDLQNGEKASEFVEDFKNILEGMGSEEEQLKTLESAKDFVDNVVGEDVLENLDPTVQETLEGEIDRQFENNPDLAQKIKDLLGLGGQA